MTSWWFYNRAWQPQRHDRLPETSGTLWIHRGALTNQRCSLATGCGINSATSNWTATLRRSVVYEITTETGISHSDVYLRLERVSNLLSLVCAPVTGYIPHSTVFINEGEFSDFTNISTLPVRCFKCIYIYIYAYHIILDGWPSKLNWTRRSRYSLSESNILYWTVNHPIFTHSRLVNSVPA